MKLVTYESGKGPHVGAVEGEYIVDIPHLLTLLDGHQLPTGLVADRRLKEAAALVVKDGTPPPDMIDFLERGEAWQHSLGLLISGLMASLDPAQAPQRLLTRLESAHLKAPLSCPKKIVCVGLNYADHAEKARQAGFVASNIPIFFVKTSNAIIGPGEPIVLPPNSIQVDYEAELAVVIGKKGRGIAEENAYEYVAGYSILNDVTARDMQSSDNQWFRGKSCDTFAPTGPWIVTRDEVPNPHNLGISLTLNGRTMQDSTTNKMIHTIPYLISYLSQSLTWEVGDLLATGTPAGIGSNQNPVLCLKHGDILRITIERIGTLENPVA